MRDRSAKTRWLLRDAIPALASDTRRTVAPNANEEQQCTQAPEAANALSEHFGTDTCSQQKYLDKQEKPT
jgi:hypothetical protein